MKTLLSLCLALLAVNVASAQIFRPRPVNGAVIGRGAHSGDRDRGPDGNRDRWSGQGGSPRGGYHDSGHGFGSYRHYGHHDRHHRHGHLNFGYFGSPFRYSHFPRYSVVPSYGYYSGYGYGYPYYDSYGYYGTGSAATNGLLLGALAGGIIGHNSGTLHHSAWRGSAWGAGLGWVLGSVVDANRRAAVYQQPHVAYQQPQVALQPQVQVQPQPAAPAQPQQVTVINNYYNSSTPMSGVNGMFGR